MNLTRYCSQTLARLSLLIAGALAACRAAFGGVIPQPKLPGGGTADDPWTAATTLLKESGLLGIKGIYVILILVVVSAVIYGLVQGFKRGEWGAFALIVLVGIIALIFGGLFLYQGETVITSF